MELRDQPSGTVMLTVSRRASSSPSAATRRTSISVSSHGGPAGSELRRLPCDDQHRSARSAQACYRAGSLVVQVAWQALQHR